MIRTKKEENKGVKKEEWCSKEVKENILGGASVLLREKG